MKQIRWDTLLTPLIGIVLGIYLVARPGSATTVLCSLIGWLVLVAGVAGIINAVSFQHATMLESPLLPFSVVSAVIGLFIVTRPSILAEIVSLILCVFLLIEGASGLQRAFQRRNWGDRLWVVPLVVGLLSLLVGLWMLFAPLASTFLMMRVVGVALIVSSAVNLLASLIGQR